MELCAIPCCASATSDVVPKSIANRDRGPSTRMHVWNRPPLPNESPEPTNRTVTAIAAARSPLLRGHVLVEERQHLRPGVLGLRLPVTLGVHEVEERMPGAVVHVELVRLLELRELGVDLVHVRRRRVRVLGAEEPDERARDVLGEVERRRRLAPVL